MNNMKTYECVHDVANVPNEQKISGTDDTETSLAFCRFPKAARWYWLQGLVPALGNPGERQGVWDPTNLNELAYCA